MTYVLRLLMIFVLSQAATPLTNKQIAAQLRMLADTLDPSATVPVTPIVPAPAPVMVMPSMPMPRMADIDNVLALVPVTKATCIAKQSGLWSNPVTWGGTLPKTDDFVLIPGAVSVTQDIDTPKLKVVRIDGTFSPAMNAKCTLWTDLIVSTESGVFAAGMGDTAAFTGQWNIKIADYGPLDPFVDPYYLGRGLITLGQVSIYGTPRTSRAFLAADALDGQLSLNLKTPMQNLIVGDHLFVPGVFIPRVPRSWSDPPYGAADDDIAIVQSISSDGLTIGLTTPLKHDHLLLDGKGLPRPMFVANITPRNVHIFSENPSPTTRGHVMLMRSDMSVPRVIHGASFFDLGRTDKSQPLTRTELGQGTTNVPGRYSLHFHEGGTDVAGMQADVSDCLVSGSPGWGFVNHSDNVCFTRCVTLGVFGAGAVGEKGNEIGCYCDLTVLRSSCPVNVSITDNNGGQNNGDWGKTGFGVMLMGGGIALEGTTLITGCQVPLERQCLQFGFNAPQLAAVTFDVKNLPAKYQGKLPSTVSTILPSQVPFDDANLFSFGCLAGPNFWNVNENATEIPLVGRSTFRDSKCEDNGGSITLGYLSCFDLLNLTLVGGNYERTFGIGHSGVSSSITIDGNRILGYESAVMAPTLYDNKITNNTIDAINGVVIYNATQRRRSITIAGNIFKIVPADMAALKAGASSWNHTYYDPTQQLVQRAIVMRPSLGGTDFYLSDLTDFTQSAWGIVGDDVVTYNGQNIFFPEMGPGFPLDLVAARPAIVAGMTNGQMWAKYGITIGGKVLPADAAPLAGSLCLSSTSPARLIPDIQVTKHHIQYDGWNSQTTNQSHGYSGHVLIGGMAAAFGPVDLIDKTVNIVPLPMPVNGELRSIWVRCDSTVTPAPSW